MSEESLFLGGLDKLESRVNQLLERVHAVQAEKAELTTTLAETQRRLAEKEARLEALESHVSGTETLRRSLDARLGEMQSRIEAFLNAS